LRIPPEEEEIVGGWTNVQGCVEADRNCHRIEALTTNLLREVAGDSSGWSTLYVDPDDGRFWELTYPNSEMHGGGPPHLKCLSGMEVRKKYGDDALTG